jgi:small GTP-binding protein
MAIFVRNSISNFLYFLTTTQPLALNFQSHPLFDHHLPIEYSKLFELPMSGELTEARDAKIVLAGNTSVGKTSIVSLATTGVFGSDVAPTLGASFTTKSVIIGSVEVRMQIWDTAGQERFRTMTPMYFRDADVALLAYAVDDAQSFQDIDSWVMTIRQHASRNIVLILVGNKYDQEEARQVSRQDGEDKAAEIAALFYEVSALTGYRIEDVFQGAAWAFLEKKQKKEAVRIIDPAEGEVEKGMRCC